MAKLCVEWFGLVFWVGCVGSRITSVADDVDGLDGEPELGLFFNVGIFFGSVSVKTREPNVGGEIPHPPWGGSPSIYPSHSILTEPWRWCWSWLYAVHFRCVWVCGFVGYLS